jgi:hypothetical protein
VYQSKGELVKANLAKECAGAANSVLPAIHSKHRQIAEDLSEFSTDKSLCNQWLTCANPRRARGCYAMPRTAQVPEVLPGVLSYPID